VIVVGDFMQLPPVVKNRSQLKFCFQSALWDEVGFNRDNGTKFLRQVERQKDKDFVDFLNQVRVGKVSSHLISLLDQCLVENKPKIVDGIIPTKLYSINKEVDEENSARLAELPGEVHSLKAEDRWRQKPSKKSMEPMFRNTIDAIIPEEIQLKVGAQVMLLRNRSKGQFGAFAAGTSGPSLVNGSRGKIVAFVESVLRPGTSLKPNHTCVAFFLWRWLYSAGCFCELFPFPKPICALL
jgi:ATP-dependent DNA helicase PIF1